MPNVFRILKTDPDLNVILPYLKGDQRVETVDVLPHPSRSKPRSMKEKIEDFF